MVYVLVVGPVMEMDSAMVEVMERVRGMESQVVKVWVTVVVQVYGRDLIMVMDLDLVMDLGSVVANYVL
jgi:hypothetical protein